MVKYVNPKYTDKDLSLVKENKFKKIAGRVMQIGGLLIAIGAIASLGMQIPGVAASVDDYIKSGELNTEISQTVTTGDENYDFKDVDFTSLKKINKDTVGWIECDGTKIDYPVVQSDDNDYYLHHSIKKEDSFSGTIFMDTNNNKDFKDDVTVLYGHNMKNDSMFGSLSEYNKQSYFDKHSKMYYHTDDAVYEFDLFGAVNQDATTLTVGNYNSKDKFKSDMKTIKENSSFKSKVKVDENSKVVCLYTCLDTGSNGTNNRYLVYGTVNKVLDKTKQVSSSKTM